MIDDLPLDPLSVWAYLLGVPFVIGMVAAAVRWRGVGQAFVALFFLAWAVAGLGMLAYAIVHHIPTGNYAAAIFLLVFGALFLAPLVQGVFHALARRNRAR